MFGEQLPGSQPVLDECRALRRVNRPDRPMLAIGQRGRGRPAGPAASRSSRHSLRRRQMTRREVARRRAEVLEVGRQVSGHPRLDADHRRRPSQRGRTPTARRPQDVGEVESDPGPANAARRLVERLLQVRDRRGTGWPARPGPARAARRRRRVRRLLGECSREPAPTPPPVPPGAWTSAAACAQRRGGRWRAAGRPAAGAQR